MGKIKIHAGDFPESKHTQFLNQTFLLDTGKRGPFAPKWEKVKAKQVETFEIATEESVKRLSGTLGWGALGAVAFGPLGLLAGLIAGGRRNEVTFILRFKDGRKMFATTDSKTYTQMQASIF